MAANKWVNRKTPEERKAWWRGLQPEAKAAYIARKEQSRRPEAQPRIELDVAPLTKPQMRKINTTMRRIGLEAYIVLPDV